MAAFDLSPALELTALGIIAAFALGVVALLGWVVRAWKRRDKSQ
jgi:hypothetical protein